MAALLAWGVSMTTRQAGHFFFEPRGYDEVNQATDEHKEEIKVGYNLQRKIVLMAPGLRPSAGPVADPTLFGLFEALPTFDGFVHNVGMAGWRSASAGCCSARCTCSVLQADLMTGLVWMTKILTDPFHDIKLYSPRAAASAARRTDRPDAARPGRVNPIPPAGRPRARPSPGHLTRAISCAAFPAGSLAGWTCCSPAAPPPAVGLHLVAAATKRCSTAAKSSSL
jgi:hypothetical protein